MALERSIFRDSFMHRTNLLLLCASGAALLVIGCGKTPEQPPASPVKVSTITVAENSVPVTRTFVGEVQSVNLVEVRSKVSGYLVKQSFEEGKIVQEGQELFVIDPKPFEAALEAAKAMLAEAKARLDVTQRNLARAKSLIATNAISQRDLDNSVAAASSADAAVQGAQANVESAQLNLEYATIKSPITGLIGRSLKKVGSLMSVSLGDDGVMARVTPLGEMNVDFGISEAEYLGFKKDLAAKRIAGPEDGAYLVDLKLSDGTLHPQTGRVKFREPTIDKTTGTIAVTASVPDPEDLLIPGQFVRVIVRGMTKPNAIVVPQRAVLQGAKGKMVYTVEGGNTASPRVIEVGEWIGEDWEVLGGLKPGDIVAVDGAVKLQPGAPVIVANEQTAAEPTSKS
ncbi:MAG: hypothetical protein RL417_2055 [Pseudomonadota bacterium]|jgi:membrane fusion protein (multidrug efflux system)